MRTTEQVQTDLYKLICENLPEWKKWLTDVDDDDENQGGQLTIGLPNDGDQWGFQTGDNSFTGGAYGFPHWAVCWFTHETTPEELYQELLEEINQIEVYHD